MTVKTEPGKATNTRKAAVPRKAPTRKSAPAVKATASVEASTQEQPTAAAIEAVETDQQVEAAAESPAPAEPTAAETNGLESLEVEMAKGKAVVALPLGEVHRNEDQPREYFDSAALMELAASMAERTQLQPIIVRKDEERGGYEIVMGERRWRAAHLNEAETIDAVIIDGPYTLRSFKDAVAENLNREDMTPIEEARAFKRILNEEEGATPESVAADFGKTTQFVNLRLKLLDLIPAIAEHVNKGAIGTQAAVQISQLTPANQKAVLAKWARGEFASENELVHFVFQVKQQQNQPLLLALEDMTEEQRVERLANRKATRTQLDQIERMIAKLDAIATKPLPELVDALEGEFTARLDQLGRVSQAVSKAMFQLRQSKAAAEAHAIVVNPEALPPTQPGTPESKGDSPAEQDTAETDSPEPTAPTAGQTDSTPEEHPAEPASAEPAQQTPDAESAEAEAATQSA
ncbi:ParB/RepB/Spo0J family partition protein [Kitasatospora sp. NPDC002227]|uniref:ParB/RepB/Spo0J family partition protein n=1 Tax=Kitasatospora sp. NPDC002227 TaxID=3154773 RepID=UPI00332D4457